MRRPVRLALVVVGLAVAVYGVASLTGGWLGTPPWWDVVTVIKQEDGWWPLFSPAFTHWTRTYTLPPERHRPPESVWFEGIAIVGGLGLVALGAWPRRRGPASHSGGT
jgi:hypothetical protein